MQDAKEEIRSKLNIEDIIGDYVQLKRAGRNFRGLSPFTGEKTPSFYVSPEKHIWHDFSSNKGGDIYSFIMEVEGMDFRQALEMLARRAGVDLTLYDNRSSQEITRRKKRLFEILELATNYYQQSLIKNQKALEYVFKKRKLDKSVVQNFRIGFAPSSGDALVNFLQRKGFTKDELAQAGLTNRFGGDLFRGRMTVPLMDAVGQIVGFTGRIIEDDPESPKYLNTPQTLLYDKGRHVFGLSQAKDAIRSRDYVVVVEGNLDVVSSHQAEIKEVVATAGTAITEHHLRALLRLTNHIRLSFDSDKAGVAATERAIPLAQIVGADLSIISISEAKDPDELIKKDPGLWRQSIESSEPAVEWILRQYATNGDLNTAAGKRYFTSQALKIISGLQDIVEQEYYLVKAAEISGSSLEALKEKLLRQDEPQVKILKKATKVEKKVDGIGVYQDNLLSAAIISPAVGELFREIDPDLFSGEHRQAVAGYIKESGGRVLQDTPDSLQNFDTYVKILLLRAEARYSEWTDQDRYYEVARLLRQIKIENKKQQKNELTETLREAENAGDEIKSGLIREKINKIIKEINNG